MRLKDGAVGMTAAQRPTDLTPKTAEAKPSPFFRSPSPLLFTEIHLDL